MKSLKLTRFIIELVHLSPREIEEIEHEINEPQEDTQDDWSLGNVQQE